MYVYACVERKRERGYLKTPEKGKERPSFIREMGIVTNNWMIESINFMN